MAATIDAENYPCGHSRHATNTYRYEGTCRCLACKRVSGKDYEKQRKRRMAEMIDSAERKLAGLYREAHRYGMDTILRDKSFSDEAWDHEVRREQIRATLSGEPSSIGGAE